MKKLTAGSWYSGGVDGFSYAAQKLNIETLYHIESNRSLWKYLRQNYPNGKLYGHDEYARDLPFTNIIFGGDPCQPSSTAGKGLGKEDDRYRWPVMFKGIQTIRPDWVINENVAGTISNMVLDQKITDLESIGYTCQTYNIPAVSVNAHHARQRVWLVAYSNVQRRRELLQVDFGAIFKESKQAYSLGAFGNAFLQFEESQCEPALFPVAYGIPDHIIRLGAVGNSIVHQIPLIILQAIQWIENNYL